MARPAGVRLPALGEQLERPRPVLAWTEAASPAAALRSRQPSIPRMARGNPCVGLGLQCSVLGKPSGGRGGAAPGFGALGPGRCRRPHGLRLPGSVAPWARDLPELQRRASEPRPCSGTSGQPLAEALAAPELPGVELAASEATSDETSDAESSDTESRDQTSGTEASADLSEWSPSPPEAGAGLRRTGAIARDEDERRCPRRPHAWPTSAAASPLGQGLCRRAPHPEGSQGAPRAASLRRAGGEPAPARPGGEAPGGARPGCAGRSLSARGSRPPRSPGTCEARAREVHPQGTQPAAGRPVARARRVCDGLAAHR
ncbi:unnamed protein product [Prorocentrum cordatum]|uniref:Uncharacterized protein n=1 Tax=Prorocentrum cordatum TaxID=2364126 RepID=A0ABN9TAU0_9DINO|nr:unnamed protein product [Polarella glacialis]